MESVDSRTAGERDAVLQHIVDVSISVGGYEHVDAIYGPLFSAGAYQYLVASPAAVTDSCNSSARHAVSASARTGRACSSRSSRFGSDTCAGFACSCPSGSNTTGPGASHADTCAFPGAPFPVPPVPTPQPTECGGDGVDNDNDGDADEPDESCISVSQESCESDGMDNNGDGSFDEPGESCGAPAAIFGEIAPLFGEPMPPGGFPDTSPERMYGAAPAASKSWLGPEGTEFRRTVMEPLRLLLELMRSFGEQ